MRTKGNSFSSEWLNSCVLLCRLLSLSVSWCSLSVCPLTHSHSFIHSLTLTHARTHTHAHTHTHKLSLFFSFFFLSFFLSQTVPVFSSSLHINLFIQSDLCGPSQCHGTPRLSRCQPHQRKRLCFSSYFHRPLLRLHCVGIDNNEEEEREGQGRISGDC